MIVTVAKRRFIHSSLDYLIRSGFLGETLIHEAETAQAFRQTEKLEALGSILSVIKEYRLIGQYYIAWCLNRKGQDVEKLFEKVAEESSSYRSMALIELATGQARKGDLSLGVSYYTEALKYSKNPYTTLLAERSIAAVKGIEGFHKSALRDLEKIAPLLKYSQPIEKCQYLNSLAIELGEAGRIEEAQEVCKIVLASPFAFAYPEWRETAYDIDLRGYKSRSSVRVIQSFPGNVVSMPKRESSGNPHSAIFGSAPVVSLKGWKKENMVKEPNDDENVDQMDFNELIVKLLQITACEEASEEKLRKVVKSAIKIMKD